MPRSILESSYQMYPHGVYCLLHLKFWNMLHKYYVFMPLSVAEFSPICETSVTGPLNIIKNNFKKNLDTGGSNFYQSSSDGDSLSVRSVCLIYFSLHICC